MSLDFSALNNIPLQGAKQARTGNPRNEESQDTSTESGNLHRLENEKRERENARQMYAGYQQNIKIAGILTSDILKGLKAGEDPLAILLKAVECISLMTGDSVLLDQCKESMIAVYGWGLGKEIPLEVELEEAKKRLTMLTRPELSEAPQNAQHIQTAINAHRDLIQRIERIIEGNRTM